MLASRFWYVLSAIVIGVLSFTLFVGASMYDREAKRSMSEGLGADVQVVTWYLKDDARKRSSSLIQFALDDDLVKALAKSSTAYDKVPQESRDKAKKAIAAVSSKQPADIAFSSLFAVDQNGRVVAMQGFEQAAGMDDFELGGYPVVADALHGWIRDDSWVLDGRIYRVVARPVEGDTSQPPAGAIVGLRIVDDSFARDLSKRTGAALAFYANGTSYTSAAPEGFDKAQLDATISDLGSLANDEKYQKSGRSDVRILRDNLAVVYAKIPGESFALGAGVAVGRSALLVGGPMGFLKKSDDADKKSVPLPLLIGAAAGIALFGLIFSFLEHSRPLSVFKKEAEKLAKGETDQLQPSKFRGTYRKIASDLNDGIERAAVKGGGGTRKAADLDAVLGPMPAQPAMSAFSLPDASAPLGVVLPQVGGPSSDRRPPPPSRHSEPSANVELDSLMGGAPATGPGARKPPPPRPGSGPQPPPPTSAGAAKPAAVHDERAEWQQVYEDFVALKKENGEPTDGFTYEKFQGTLQKHRDAITSKFNCKRVKFSVYTKDGKAALKATPAQDLVNENDYPSCRPSCLGCCRAPRSALSLGRGARERSRVPVQWYRADGPRLGLAGARE